MPDNEKISEGIMDQKFYQWLLLTGSSFLNSFLAVVFQPKQFFSKTDFSEHKWSENAISFFIISYVVFYSIFIVRIREILKIPELRDMVNKSLQDFGGYTGVFIQVYHFIFVINLSLYLILWIFRQRVSIYKIINILSYTVGTSMLLLSLTFKSVLPKYLTKTLTLYTLESLFLFGILGYILFLIYKSNRYALKLSMPKSIFVGILGVIGATIFSIILG